MPLTIQLQPSGQQTAFNLQRWAELLTDPELARLPYRVETDRHGHIVMSHTPAPRHGNFQSEIAHLLRSWLPRGRVITECPLSTSDGVKAVDVAWLRPGRAEELRAASCLVHAPEVCVEVLSLSNTPPEIAEKIVLYFEAGALEVWTCDQDGILEFHFSRHPEVWPASKRGSWLGEVISRNLCPEGLECERNTGWKPMLLCAVASPFQVHGDGFRDASWRSFDSPEGQCSIAFQPVFCSQHRAALSRIAPFFQDLSKAQGGSHAASSASLPQKINPPAD